MHILNKFILYCPWWFAAPEQPWQGQAGLSQGTGAALDCWRWLEPVGADSPNPHMTVTCPAGAALRSGAMT